MTDALLTVPEYASYAKVDPDTIRKLCRAGELPAVRFGRQWRLPASSLQAVETQERDVLPLAELAPRLTQAGLDERTAGWLADQVRELAGAGGRAG